MLPEPTPWLVEIRAAFSTTQQLLLGQLRQISSKQPLGSLCIYSNDSALLEPFGEFFPENCLEKL